jgi:hypothetical protein
VSDTWSIVVSILGLAIVLAGFALEFVSLDGRILLAVGILLGAYAAIEARGGSS